MRHVQTIAQTREAVRELRAGGTSHLGLVPTMGALHAGHLSLVRAAKQTCGVVAASIFVNPTQFGANEDLSRYPRTLAADLQALEAAGVDLVFTPNAEEMYPEGSPGVTIDPGQLGDRLDGRFRTGHFRGVATVVAKLFAIFNPEQAFFGQKDAAQVAVLAAMVRDLNLPVRLSVCPTVREADGLAMSSRNRYLAPGEREEAARLFQALTAAETLAAKGERDSKRLLETLRSQLCSPGVRVEYTEMVDPATLLPLAQLDRTALLAVAAFVGDTRLIDNLLVSPQQEQP